MPIGGEYPKIETLFNRGDDFVVKVGEYRMAEFGVIDPSAWIFQEKIDGTNIRIGWDGQTVEFNGRTDRAQLPGDLVNYLKNTFTPERMVGTFNEGGLVTLYGEGFGPGIQKGGGLYRDSKSFILFDVRVGEWWLNVSDVEGAAQSLGVDVVPRYNMTWAGVYQHLVEGTLPSLYSAKYPVAEGVIMRTEPIVLTRQLRRVIAKLKCCDFKPGRK